MNYDELKMEVLRIRMKQDRGEALTDREWTILAYTVNSGTHGQNIFEGSYREDLTPEEERELHDPEQN